MAEPLQNMAAHQRSVFLKYNKKKIIMKSPSDKRQQIISEFFSSQSIVTAFRYQSRNIRKHLWD